MPKPLPFEHDSPELLEAAALAMRGVDPAPARTGQDRRRAAEPAPVYALWQRAPQDGAAVARMPEVPPEAETVFPDLDLAALRTGFSVEDLSREIERDARRFEAN